MDIRRSIALPDRRTALHDAGFAVAFIVAFVALGRASNQFQEFLNISPWWLPAALTFALFVRKGWRWVGVAWVAEMASAVINFDVPVALEAEFFHVARDAAVGRVGYALAAVLAVRVLMMDRALRRPRDVVIFVLCGVGVGAGISALGGILGNVVKGAATLAEAPEAILLWWAGDAVAVIVLGAPLVMVSRVSLEQLRSGWRRRQGLVEGAAQAMLVLGTPILALQIASHRSYLFLCFVPLAWVALRRGIAVTACSALVMNVVTTYAVGHQTNQGVTLADLQLFMGTLTVTALLLGAVVSQLQELNRDLEERVIARTSELAAANDQLSYQATHDPLTGLANRVLFDDRLQNALDRRRRQPALLGVLLLDLDGFKAINDTHGHAVGDVVLATVGERLRRLMRTEDTVARLGGDEFAVVLDAGVKDQAVEAVTQRIIASLTQPIQVGGFTVSVGASIGAAMTDGAVEAAQLLREADSQMYAVKRNGKGRASIRAVTAMLG